jgi:hypothetical protein
MRRTISFALISILFVSASEVSAQTGSGDIQVLCPPGVEILLDSKAIGRSNTEMNGIYLENIPVGRHQIEARLPGYQALEKSVVVERGKTAEIELVFGKSTETVERIGTSDAKSAVAFTSSLEVRSVPTGASLAIDGVAKGQIDTGLRIKNLAVGAHVIRCTSGGRVLSMELQVSRFKLYRLKANFVKKELLVESVEPLFISLKKKQEYYNEQGELDWYTTFEYDSKGRLLKESNNGPEGALRDYRVYDFRDERPVGDSVYDAGGRLQFAWTYSYDINGNKAKSIGRRDDGSLLSTTVYEYRDGREVKSTEMNGIGTVTQIVEKEYYPDGRQKSETYKDGSGRIKIFVETIYDAAGRELRVNLGGGRHLDYTYSVDGRKKTGVSYDAGGRKTMLMEIDLDDYDNEIRVIRHELPENALMQSYATEYTIIPNDL